MTEEQFNLIRQCIKDEVAPLKSKVDDIELGLFGNKVWGNKGLILEVKELSAFKRDILKKAYKAGGFMAAVVLIFKWGLWKIVDLFK